MAKFSAWVRKHLAFGSRRETQSKNQPPFLSSPRRPVTPTSLSTPACLFFKLPYDIRNIILLMIFSGPGYHVDIMHQEGIWQWRGYVCTRDDRLGLCYDRCIENIESCKRTGKSLDNYHLGVMGFLLSCRQAYTEGIDVLYSSNCISIKTEPLLLYLPKLIPHNRLASITSLEIIVDAHPVKQDNNRTVWKMDHLEPILNNIAIYCLHLRAFSLSLTVWQRHGHDLLDGPAMPSIDAFWTSTRLRNMRVALPARDYRATETSEITVGHPHEVMVQSRFGTLRWRCLDSEKPKVQRRSVERYPFPPLKLPVLDGNESAESSGYWLCEGHEGAHPGYHSCGVH